ncbi:hypothetical protein [Streptomyces silvisoli]|uniref:Transposase IS701-like DDE domain-containing protein n=1 Tax=Streptomyces silvisoli TaxID=3034235 RepID=A0ABT5ZTB5_9ACTN|nr:hypothetical protein [Streptomyces silvisoli]MDF3293070.1 hypothetical protein [Streptomyces silvisoli]
MCAFLPFGSRNGVTWSPVAPPGSIWCHTTPWGAARRPLDELIRIASSRWAIEESFQTAKQDEFPAIVEHSAEPSVDGAALGPGAGAGDVAGPYAVGDGVGVPSFAVRVLDAVGDADVRVPTLADRGVGGGLTLSQVAR